MSAPHAASLRELRKAHEHNLSTEYKSGETDGVELTGHADAVMNVLRKHSAGEFVHGDVVEFAANTPCFDALKVMSAKHITGAPVYETIADQSQEWMSSAYPRAVPIVQKLYHGFVDVADVAALGLRAGFKAKKKGFLGKLAALMESDEAHAVVSAVNLSGRNLFYTLTTIDNLTKAAAKMATDGVHRVAILDPERTTILGVLTQSHIVRLLFENLGVVGEVAGLQVERLFENGLRVVRCVPTTATVRECLDIMLQRNISSVPIVSESGALVGVFSFSDLRVVAGKPIADANAALEKPVMWLISPHEGDKVTSIPRRPVVVMPSDCLATVMELLVTTRVHRVYIVDRRMRPLGVVSLTDVLRVLTSPIVVTRLRAASLEESMMEAFCDVDSEEKHYVTPVKDVPGGESPLATLLRSTSADEFVHKDGVRIDKLVDVSNKESLKHVLQLMRTHGLCVLPVYREVPAVSEAPLASGSMPPSLLMVTGLVKPVEKHYIGWIDAADAVSYLLETYQHEREPSLADSIRDFFRPGSTAQDAMNKSDCNPFWAIPLTRGLDQVTRVLAEHVHRLAVIDTDDSNRVSGIITQSALARYVLEHRDLLGDVASIQMATFVKEDIAMLTCSVHATLMQAFDIMTANKRKGVGIVDGEGKLVSSISVSDVRYLYSINPKAVHHVLEQNVMEFLKQERTSERLVPFTVRSTDSFPTALLVVLAAECHRVYIVDDSMRPIGVFTLSDALKTIAPPSLVKG